MSVFESLKEELHKAMVNFIEKVKDKRARNRFQKIMNELTTAMTETKNAVQFRMYMEKQVDTLPKNFLYYLPWTNSLRYDLEQVLLKECYSLTNLLLDQNITLQEKNIQLHKEIKNLTSQLESLQKKSELPREGSIEETPSVSFEIATLKAQLNQLADRVTRQSEEIELLRDSRDIYKKQADELRKEKEVLLGKIKQFADEKSALLQITQEQSIELQQLREEKETILHAFEVSSPPPPEESRSLTVSS